MAIAPVTPQSAALQQAVAGAGPIAPPTGQMGDGSLSNADWLARMQGGAMPAAGANSTPQATALQQAATGQQQQQQQQPMGQGGQTPQPAQLGLPPQEGAMKSSPPPNYGGTEPVAERPPAPSYQSQTYGGGESYGKGMYGEDRATPETSYLRLPGNDSVYATDGDGYKNPFLGNDRFGNAQAGSSGTRPWETSAESRAANAALAGSAAAAGGQSYGNSNNTTDEFNTIATPFGDIQVPNPYYEGEGGEGEGGDDAPVDANNDGRVDDNEYNSWRPEDARFGMGHGGLALSQANLNNLAEFGITPGANGQISEADFSAWAAANDNHGGKMYGLRAAWDEGGWDRDQNGIIGATELASYQADLYKRAIQDVMARQGSTQSEAEDHMGYLLAQGRDLNQDGVVSPDEYAESKTAEDGQTAAYETEIERVMKKQGKTRDEAVTHMGYLLAQGYDFDGNGVVTREEYYSKEGEAKRSTA